MLADFECCGVGEETNKLAGYIATVSRHLEARLAVILESSSAAGQQLPKGRLEQLRHSKLEMTGWYMKQIPESVSAAVAKMDADICRVEESAPQSGGPIQ